MLTYQGVIITGVSENYLEKVFTAQRVGDLLDALKPDGVIVVTDAWGNHHVDFVRVIEEVVGVIFRLWG